MSDQEQDDLPRPFHIEGDAAVFDRPQDQEKAARQAREDEQHEFAREQVKTNKLLARFTLALVVATFCTIAIGIWQVCVYGRQLTVMQGQLNEMQGSSAQTDKLLGLYRQQVTEMQKQVVLAQQQAEGVQAARVTFYVGFDGGEVLHIQVSNEGHAIATNIRITVNGTMINLPTGTPIKGKSWQRTVFLPQLNPLDPQGVPSNRDKRFILQEFTRSEWVHIGDLKQTMRYEWEASFDNGFGHKMVFPKSCSILFPASLLNVSPPAIEYRSEPFPCNEFEASLEKARRLTEKTQAERQGK